MFAAVARTVLFFGPDIAYYTREGYFKYKTWRQLNNECPVCNKRVDDRQSNVDFVRVVLPACKHSYHLKCLNELRKESKKCKICDKEIESCDLDNDKENQETSTDCQEALPNDCQEALLIDNQEEASSANQTNAQPISVKKEVIVIN